VFTGPRLLGLIAMRGNAEVFRVEVRIVEEALPRARNGKRVND